MSQAATAAVWIKSQLHPNFLHNTPPSFSLLLFSTAALRARLSPVISENIRATSPPLSYGVSRSRLLASRVSDVARGLLPPSGRLCQTVPSKKKEEKKLRTTQLVQPRTYQGQRNI